MDPFQVKRGILIIGVPLFHQTGTQQGEGMVFRLDAANVWGYLIQQGLCSDAQAQLLAIEPKSGKNFNLLVRLASQSESDQVSAALLVKQEPFKRESSEFKSFRQEWTLFQFFQHHSQSALLKALVPDLLHFDAARHILVCRFLEQYQDLGEFYDQTQTFPTAIATALGITLAILHQATFQQQADYLRLNPTANPDEDEVPDLRDDFEEITPAIFEQVSVEGLKFYELYQRYDSLSQAIAQLEDLYEPCCLIHDDLKFDNILLHQDWATWKPALLPTSGEALQLSDRQGVLRIIDWEKWKWGDPAQDVGAIAASYLKIWLKSLILSRDIDIQIALQLAAVPLETLQPSLVAFLRAYLGQIPEIQQVFPDFVERVLRFTGLALIESVHTKLHYRVPFGNIEICMLQVAKSLLCNPQGAIATIFGSANLLDDSATDFSVDLFKAPNSPLMPKAEREADINPEPILLPAWVTGYYPDQMLADLLQQIRIHPPDSIDHPVYAPLELSQNAGDRYQQLPETLRQTYLSRQVRNYLYDIYFSGEQERRQGEPVDLSVLKNNTVGGVDLEFFDRIQAANHSSGFADPDWVVTQVVGDRLQVRQAGLHLWVDPAVHVIQGQKIAFDIGDPVTLKLPKAQIHSEFYLAIANAGPPSDDLPLLDLYFHTTPDGAILLMAHLTQALNLQRYPFTFKILMDPLDYGRYDAGVLTMERSHYGDLHDLLQAVYPQVRSHLRDPIPLFTKRLAPGVGLAEDPAQDAPDFGLSRCQMVAEALLQTHALQNSAPEQRLTAIKQQFLQQGWDWDRPYLNPGSEDIYAPLLSEDSPGL